MMTQMNKIQSIPTHPTSYPDVNTVLHVLLKNVQTVLGNHFIGSMFMAHLQAVVSTPDVAILIFSLSLPIGFQMK